MKPKRVKDLTGNKYGRLTVLYYTRMGKKQAKWMCECECGNKTEVFGSAIVGGGTKSCGCLLKINSHRTHGMSNTRLYSVWKWMRMRCERPGTNSYDRYGGRGIKVCDRWLEFENFYEDMGDTYQEGLQLDRIDFDGNYCPENCKWSTTKEQANNRVTNVFVEYKGEKYTVTQLAEKIGMNQQTLRDRIHAGWGVDKAVETPVRKRQMKTKEEME